MPEAPTITSLQNEALAKVHKFLLNSGGVRDPKHAADWSLAAKNAASVAVSCETILKIQNGGR